MDILAGNNTNPAPPPPVNVADMGGAPTPNLPPPNTPMATPSPEQANVAHSAMVGHGFKALLSSMGGTTTQYQQTPEGPVPVEVKNSGGNFFRHILAGAILGGAAGGQAENNAGSGWAGAGAGVQAVQKNAQQQQDLARQQAQQEFQNKLTSNKENRDSQAFDTEQQVRKAQIAQANAETLKTNLLTQGASYDLHRKVSDADKERISTYTQAGLKPVFENIPESDMNDIIKNRPGASALDWRHTDVKTVLDANGNPTYQYTLSAYDPQQPLLLSKGTIDQWDKDGLFKYHPEYKDIATPGKTLTIGQFTALDKQAQSFAGQDLARNKNDLELKHLNAQIDEAKAAIKSHNATAFAANLSAQEKQEELKQRKATDTALENLAKVGGDFDKLTDPRDKIALYKSVQPMLMEVGSAIKTAEANAMTDQDAKDSLPSLWAKYQALNKMATLTSGVTAPAVQPITFIDNSGNQVVAKTQEQIDKATKLGYKKQGESPTESQQTPMQMIGDVVGAGAKKAENMLAPKSLPSFPIPTP